MRDAPLEKTLTMLGRTPSMVNALCGHPRKERIIDNSVQLITIMEVLCDTGLDELINGLRNRGFIMENQKVNGGPTVITYTLGQHW